VTLVQACTGWAAPKPKSRLDLVSDETITGEEGIVAGSWMAAVDQSSKRKATSRVYRAQTDILHLLSAW
jgi:hypothetical protein